MDLPGDLSFHDLTTAATVRYINTIDISKIKTSCYTVSKNVLFLANKYKQPTERVFFVIILSCGSRNFEPKKLGLV